MTTPLSLCYGDCDSDDDCESDLVCFFNGADDANIPPGCNGTAKTGVDYCYAFTGQVLYALIFEVFMYRLTSFLYY